MFAVVHPVLTNCATSKWCEVLVGRRIRGGSHNHDGVVHRTEFGEQAYGLRNGRCLLTDGDVDALHAKTLLVQDRVDAHRGLAGLAVTNNEFTLTTTDWGHGVD